MKMLKDSPTSLLLLITLFAYIQCTPTHKLKFLDSSSFDQMNAILSDPCLRANCAFGEICIENTDRRSYSCVNEKALAVKMKAQPNRDASSIVADDGNDRNNAIINQFGEVEQEVDAALTTIGKTKAVPNFLLSYPNDDHLLNLNDPCLSSPCSFGSLCKPINLREFICVDERTFKTTKPQREQLFSHVNDLFSKMASEKLKPDSSSSFTQLRGTKKVSTQDSIIDPCSSNPCPNELECTLIENINKTITSQDFKCIQPNKSGDNEAGAVVDLTSLCKNKEPGTRVAHPDNSKEFLSCVNSDGGFTLLSCPDELLYNKYMDRCDFNIEPLSMGCGSMPCQYGSECIDLPDDKYKCVCASGYSGVNCEQAPDFCASNPCGGANNDDGVNTCVSLSWDSPLPYYCMCGENEKYFGMSCETNKVERNPCLSDHESKVFATRIDPAIYVHCGDGDNGGQMTLKYCHKNTVFTVSNGINSDNCEWIDVQKV